MSTSYTPTSNWTNRDLKGRDLNTRPLRPAEPVSFSSDPTTDRLSRRMAEDVRPAPDGAAVQTDDDFWNQPMVNASADGAAVDGPNIFDAPMVNTLSSTASSGDSVFDAPMVETRSVRTERDDAIVATSASAAEIGDRYSVDTHAAVNAQSYGAASSRKGLSPIMMVVVPLGVVAVAAVGWLALSGGEPAAPVAETPPLEIAAAAPAADPLINMPVTETGAAVETAELAPAAAPATPTPRPVRSAPARTEPRAEQAPADVAPAGAAILAEEPSTAALSPEPTPAPETQVETPAPLISTEPLTPQ